jgi:predicted GTPase
MGYGKEQMKDLEDTISKVNCDSVIIATPIDLNRIIKIDKPNTRVNYELGKKASEKLGEIIKRKFS